LHHRDVGHSAFVHHEEKDTFGFKGGRFAFSHTQANGKLLEERGSTTRRTLALEEVL
jgi:hypothetical protein